MNDIETGFKDKTGMPIRLGDIVQIRTHRKTGGASLYIVVKKGKKIGLYVPGTEADKYSPGVRLTAQIAAVIVVVEHAH